MEKCRERRKIVIGNLLHSFQEMNLNGQDHRSWRMNESRQVNYELYHQMFVRNDIYVLQKMISTIDENL